MPLEYFWRDGKVYEDFNTHIPGSPIMTEEMHAYNLDQGAVGRKSSESKNDYTFSHPLDRLTWIQLGRLYWHFLILNTNKGVRTSIRILQYLYFRRGLGWKAVQMILDETRPKE
jgi:hypothetical protein